MNEYKVTRLVVCYAVLWMLIVVWTVNDSLPSVVDDIKVSGQMAVPMQQPSFAIRWSDRTLEKGLHFVHQQGDEHLAGLDESLGAGACAADFDNDHWVDLFLVNGSGQTRHYGKPYWWQQGQGNALFHNDHGIGFSNVTSGSGLDKTIWGMGCVASDFDNDGDMDLLVTGLGSNLLYRNEGQGHFVDVTQGSGLYQDGWSTSAAVADINGDGLLDIYIANFIDFRKGSKTFEANSQFYGFKPVTFDAGLYPATASKFYLNQGGLKFREVGEAFGISDKSGRTLDVSWQDFNEDGRADLWLANAGGSGSELLYLNEEGQGFRAADRALAWHGASDHHAIASGDLDQDGHIDVMLAGSGEQLPLVLSRRVSEGGLIRIKDLASDWNIAEVSAAHLSIWSPVINDFDNDGDEDVLFACGLVEPDADAPKLSLGQGKRLLMNLGHGRFIDSGTSLGSVLSDRQSARGVAAADFDNDGDIDLYISHNNDPGQYLQNESPQQHWLGLKLTGATVNRDAIGAEVRVKTSLGEQVKVIRSGEGFLSDSDKRLVFGLGAQTTIDEVVITWPGGRRQQLRIVAVDRYWRVEEGQEPVAIADSRPTQNHPSDWGADDPRARIAYLTLWLQHGQAADARIWRDLALAIDDAELEVRHFAIDAAAHFQSPAGLSILVHALDDHDTDIVLAALNGLRDYEDEASMRWLLRLFMHADTRVRVAVADVFAHFFREEEALIQRKYLAVPYLIRLLDDPYAIVRAAAASALGSAERFRGFHALQAHLTDPDSGVRAEVIRSLGLIRQVQVGPQLAALLQDPQQPAQVLANALIALKRLGYEASSQALEDFFLAHEPFQALALEKRLSVLLQILVQEEESSVFDAKWLRSIAHALLHQSEQQDSLALTRSWCEIFTRMPDDIGQHWLEKQRHSSSSSIRLAAYRALSKNQSEYYARQAWIDSDVSIRQWALEMLLRNEARLSINDYRLILAQPLLRTRALRIWGEQGVNIPTGILIQSLLGLPSSSDIAVRSSDRRDKLIKLCWGQNPIWQEFCPLLVSAESAPMHREIAARILLDSTLSFEMRHAVLMHDELVFDPQRVNSLYVLATRKKDPLRAEAIEHLLASDNEAVTGLARQLAYDAAEPALIRLQAIAFLLRSGHSEALELL